MPLASDSTGQLAANRRTVLKTVTVTLVVLALVTGLAVFFLYRHLDGNLRRGQDIDHLVPEAQRKAGQSDQPLNILLLGTDSRNCDGCGIDKESGEGGSDTTILLHVAADRKSAYGVSIPRDALVRRPACTTEAGDEIPGSRAAMWNAAYALGGAGCTAKQVELLTGLHIDHYIALDFAGFKGMVNAIGGVTVCIPEEVDDSAHNIHLPAGTHNLKDQQALNYVRERYSTPNSDLGRMKRQQYFIAQMINKVVSAGMLTRPDRLYRFANELTQSITTDVDHVSDLVDLATQLKDADLAHVKFTTVPNVAYSQDSPNWGRLRILPSAKRLWKRMSQDQPLGKRLGSGAISAKKPGKSSKQQAAENGLCA
ncbi:LCP family protein [Nocardioides sp. KR10-350]|uniref:LCP family protein n=1 Tax=Nocardioides cheoyonin TaxID=3156615 RepID=UPI0032B4D617